MRIDAILPPSGAPFGSCMRPGVSSFRIRGRGDRSLPAESRLKALATTSSGLSWSKGRPDAAKPRDMALAHLDEIVSATDLPVNADFEDGFAHDAAGVAESVRLAVEIGVAGLSIEDATGDAAKPLYDLDAAVERIRAARRAIDKAGGDALLVGRAECFLVGRPDLDETIGRLRAYSQACTDSRSGECYVCNGSREAPGCATDTRREKHPIDRRRNGHTDVHRQTTCVPLRSSPCARAANRLDRDAIATSGQRPGRIFSPTCPPMPLPTPRRLPA